jgi:hypothetical protein
MPRCDAAGDNLFLVSTETQRSQRGLGRNPVVLWLQRSAMFPAWYASWDSVSLRWSDEESFGARAFYKRITSLRDGGNRLEATRKAIDHSGRPQHRSGATTKFIRLTDKFVNVIFLDD